MHEGLSAWHRDWLSKHVSEGEQRTAQDWFMGHIDGLRWAQGNPEARRELEGMTWGT